MTIALNQGLLDSIQGISFREKYSLDFLDLHDFDKCFRFIRNLFVLYVSGLPTEDNLIQEQFIDLVNDGGAKCFFREMCCSDFWIEMAQTYPDVAKMALKVLMPFLTTYECETAFSTFLAIKTKSRNQLNVTRNESCPLQNRVEHNTAGYFAVNKMTDGLFL
ncbi:zinc finger BED domain-containing protein 5-like [Octopus bimaculoides]|uniref:zinc finger BED domain-containing protein 5-like n=1 Tax=Octopus bimaculoides TaxID=37653 RepID=UPI0022E2BF51|nr:zinc finger BED domain-containing protein 5-like [Octopus bimaculoides]